MASRHFQKCYRSIPGWHHVRTNLYPNISVLKTFGRCRVLFISIPLRVRIIHVGCSHYQSIVSYLTLWRINLTLRRNWYKIKQVLLIKRIKIKCHFGKITPSNSLPQIFSWLWQTFSIKTLGFLCYIGNFFIHWQLFENFLPLHLSNWPQVLFHGGRNSK